jgi:hypothetical protein
MTGHAWHEFFLDASCRNLSTRHRRAPALHRSLDEENQRQQLSIREYEGTLFAMRRCVLSRAIDNNNEKLLVLYLLEVG